MRSILVFAGLSISLSVWPGCTKTDANTCAGPGDCPAGSICQSGTCAAQPSPTLDAADGVDTNMTLYDAGPRRDHGRQDTGAPRDAGSDIGRDLGQIIDSGVTDSGEPPWDAGPPPDVPPPPMDVPVVNELTLGGECEVVNLLTDADLIDPCQRWNPNLYCVPSLNGQTAYCSMGCPEVEEEHGDAGQGGEPNPCGAGCCVPVPPDHDGGWEPGVPRDFHCRFAPDCQ